MLIICSFPSVPGTYTQLWLLLCWLFIMISSGDGSSVSLCVRARVCVWVGGGSGSCSFARENNHTLTGSPIQHSLNRPQISSRLAGGRLQGDTCATLSSLRAAFYFFTSTFSYFVIVVMSKCGVKWNYVYQFEKLPLLCYLSCYIFILHTANVDRNVTTGHINHFR